jgi:hypothetical protein
MKSGAGFLASLEQSSMRRFVGFQKRIEIFVEKSGSGM